MTAARSPRLVLATVALLCLAPQAPRTPKAPDPVAPIAFPALPRVALPVALVIDEAYRGQSKNLRPYRVGDLVEESERLAGSLFDQVTVLASHRERTTEAGTLWPRFVGFGQAAPIAEAAARQGVVVVLWSFLDPDGCLVWIDTFVGRGEAGWQEGQNKTLRLAMEDSLRAAQEALSASPELAAHAKRWSAEEAAGGFVGPPAPDSCVGAQFVTAVPD